MEKYRYNILEEREREGGGGEIVNCISNVNLTSCKVISIQRVKGSTFL